MMMRNHHLLLATSLCALTFSLSSCSAPRERGPNPLPESADPTAEQADENAAAAQRDRLLVEKYLEEAESLSSAGNVEAARLQLLKARELQPDNRAIVAKLRELNAELEQPGGAGSLTENFQRLADINTQTRLSDVLSLVDSARTALAQSDYDKALDLTRQANLNIEIGTGVDWGDLKTRVDDLRGQAIRARNQAERSQAMSIDRQVREELRRQENLNAARIATRSMDLISKSMRAFRRKQFKLAQDFALEAMRIDNNNQTARQLHDAAIKAMRESASDRYYSDMRKEFRRMQEAHEILRIPQTATFFRDEAIQARADRRMGPAATSVQLDADDAAMLKLVKQETLSGLSFTEDDGAFADVKSRIQAITGIPIIITPGARDIIDGEGLTLVMDITAPLTVENFLGLMVAESDSLAWSIHNAVVEISTKSEAGGAMATVMQDVRDLIMPRTEFIPPIIVNIPNENDDSDIPRSGGEGEEPVHYIEMDGLLETLKEATGPDNWADDESGATLDSTESGFLIITAGPAMQTQVAKTLKDLRRFSTTVVSIHSKFLSITKNFLQEIGVDWRGLGGSGSKGTVASLDDITNGLDDNASRGRDNSGALDPAGNPIAGAFFNDGGDGDIRGRTENFFTNPLGRTLSTTGGATAALTFLDDLELQAIFRAVEKREDIQEMNSQELTVLNNQRGHVAIINQTSYVRDFDIEVAQAAFIADPKIDVIQDGIVLDVKPTVNYDQKSITLELHPTVAELTRPIPTFSTSLAGTTQPVTIQLPVLTVRAFETVATIQDGASVLIGGLHQVFTTERRAEVPILGKIPLLSFFFKQEGRSDESKSLVVLIRGEIIDVTTLHR